MASTLSPVIVAFKSDAAIVKGMAVKIGTDNEHVAKCAAASDKAIGIAQNTVTAAEVLVEVAVGGGAKGCAQTTVVAGDVLCSHTDGYLKPSTTTGERIVGVAMESAVASDVFEVAIHLGLHY